MAIEDIKKELEKRFAEPLDEFYKRRIIFWNDEDGEFLDEIESLTLCNAKVLVLEAGHLFSVKQILSSTDLITNYLVYNPLVVDPEHDWFLDIKLYSEEYRADKTSTVPKDREFKCTFNLKSQQFSNTETYYLVIVDEEGKKVPIKEEVQIDIAMAIGDFDFFGLDGE